MSDQNAQSVAYVRGTMVAQQPAPAGQRGPLKWMQDNLFSSLLNTALTVLGLLVIWWFVGHFWGWFAHSVWNANSVSECRQIITDGFGEGATGACWGVIRERWHQYIFGFYPPELYWRPVLVLGLLMTVLAPILFSERLVNRQRFLLFAAAFTLIAMVLVKAPMVALGCAVVVLAGLYYLAVYRPGLALMAAALFPFFAVWLLWGGSFWAVVVVLAGLALGWAAMRALSPMGALAAALAAILVPVLWWLFAAAPVEHKLIEISPLAITPVGSDQFGGFLLAIVLGVGGIAMSLPLGVILALGRRSDMFLVKALSVMFIEFIRGVPLITLLFVASLLLNYFLPPGTNFDIILRVMILVTLFAAAYIAEVVRGGLAALPRGQYEAADALGLDYWKAQRLIILPQALKISIPGIVSTFIGMFKDTTLVVFVGLFDPLKGISDFVRADFDWKGIYWEPYIFVAAIFFIINFSMSRYSMYLENRLKRDHR